MAMSNSTMHKQAASINGRDLSTALAGLGAVMGMIAVALALFNVPAYTSLIQEDGIVEYGSAFFWFLAAVAGVFGLLKKTGAPNARRIIACLLIGFFVVCGGEEISWGQRVVGFAGPEQLLAINKQGETNLHNIGSISVFSNVFFLLTVVFFLVLPRITDKNASRFALLRQNLPVVSPGAKRVYVISLVVWIVIGLRFGTLGFHPFSAWGHYTQMDDEIFEFFAAYSFFAFSLLDSFAPPSDLAA